MLRQRLLVSSLLIPSLVGLFAWDHQLGARAPVLLVLATVLAARLAFELVQLLHRRDLRASWPLSGIGAAVLVIAGWSDQFWQSVCECLAGGTSLERVAGALSIVVLVLLAALILFRTGSARAPFMYPFMYGRADAQSSRYLSVLPRQCGSVSN